MEAKPGAAASPANAHGPFTLAVDIGGTGVKALVLDSAGEQYSPRQTRPTPRPAEPTAVVQVVQRLAELNPAFDRVAVGFPGVVRQGVTITAPNLTPSWARFPLAQELEQTLGRPTRVANDADVQGFGAIVGDGLEMVITLGTGMGSALFVDGILVPNLELAHHPFAEGKTYEQLLGQQALETLGEMQWLIHLQRAIDLMRQTFNFDVLYLGGGNSRRLNHQPLPNDVRTVPNIAGLLGGIALWTGVHGTSLVRAPQAEGAHCVVPQATSLTTGP